MARRLPGLVVGALVAGAGWAWRPASAETLTTGPFVTAIPTLGPTGTGRFSYADLAGSAVGLDHDAYAGLISQDVIPRDLTDPTDESADVGLTFGAVAAGFPDDIDAGQTHAYPSSHGATVADDLDGGVGTGMTSMASPTDPAGDGGHRATGRHSDALKARGTVGTQFAFGPPVNGITLTLADPVAAVPQANPWPNVIRWTGPTVPFSGVRFVGGVPIGLGQAVPHADAAATPLPASWAGGCGLFAALLVRSGKLLTSRRPPRAAPLGG